MNLGEILLIFLVKWCFVLVTISHCVSLCGCQQLTGTACNEANHAYESHESVCTQFYQCDSGNIWVLKTCPLGTMFNALSGSCDLFLNVSWCQLMESLSTTSSTSAKIDTSSSGVSSSTSENTKTPKSTELLATIGSALGIPSLVPNTSCSTIKDPRSICIMSCVWGTKFESTTLDEFMKTILSEMTVDRKNTSAYRRKYNSARDNRPSAQSIGSVGIAVIVGVILLFILSDLSSLCCKPTFMKKKVIY